jgi:thioredoxin-like negative regulator of GroEL
MICISIHDEQPREPTAEQVFAAMHALERAGIRITEERIRALVAMESSSAARRLLKRWPTEAQDERALPSWAIGRNTF